MDSVTGIFHGGKIELPEAVNWPDGTKVVIRPLAAESHAVGQAPLDQWPMGFFDRLRAEWGDEPFERPSQGQVELREEW